MCEGTSCRRDMRRMPSLASASQASHLNLTLHLKLNLTTELVKACSLDTLLSW